MRNLVKVERGLSQDELFSIMQEKESEVNSSTLYWGEEANFVIDGQKVIVRFLYCDEQYEAIDSIIYTYEVNKNFEKVYDVYTTDDTEFTIING